MAVYAEKEWISHGRTMTSIFAVVVVLGGAAAGVELAQDVTISRTEAVQTEADKPCNVVVSPRPADADPRAQSPRPYIVCGSGGQRETALMLSPTRR